MSGKKKIPRYFRITRKGKWFILLTIAVGTAAINTGNNLIYLCLALNLSLLITSGTLSDLATRRVTFDFSDKSVLFAEKNDPPLIFKVENRKKHIPLFHTVVYLEFGDRVVEAPCPYVPPGGSALVAAPVAFPSRGIRRVTRITLMTTFPFGFFEKYYHAPCRVPIPVAPHPTYSPVTPSEDDGTAPLPGKEKSRLSSNSGHSMRDVREYTPRDPMKNILWKKFASTGTLYVKVLEDDDPAEEEIPVLPHPDPEVFERTLSAVTGKVLSLTREGKPFRLIFEDGILHCDLTPSSRKEVFVYLALVRNDALMVPWRPAASEVLR
ncbi:MAG: DUF58 domain-containing protein [Deltaproteobacteria bacterium]|nr:MAG: DUF58 domain-containing protein [Deltaproteobacteria bacterium]